MPSLPSILPSLMRLSMDTKSTSTHTHLHTFAGFLIAEKGQKGFQDVKTGHFLR